MGRLLTFALALMQLSGNLYAGQASTLRVKPPFQVPEALSVTDIAYPFSSPAGGTVVLDVMINTKGKVEDVRIRRNIPALVPEAVQAVKNWKFSPATFAGQPMGSRMTVALNFRPPFTYAPAASLPPLAPPPEQGGMQSRFQPPEVSSAAFPDYAPNTEVSGAVVVEVTLSNTGKALHSKVLRALPPQTAQALQAIKKWKFTPASFDGRPVESQIDLAFVFRPLFGNR